MIEKDFWSEFAINLEKNTILLQECLIKGEPAIMREKILVTNRRKQKTRRHNGIFNNCDQARSTAVWS